jgi:hypothetical protein
MKKFFILAISCTLLFACNSGEKTESNDEKMSSGTDLTKKETPPAEFADPKYVEWGKKQLATFQSGNIDEWLASYADNAKYYWSGGDSLVGKQAITDYWKNRRDNVIKEIKFSNDIWLALKINKPQQAQDVPGIWVMGWYQVNVTYNSGKSLQFWVHNDQHLDNNDKVDVAVQYIDMAPVNKALGK